MEMKMIGNKISEARKKLNKSQAELAQQLFISPQAVGKWERGESIPDLITFNRLAKVFGVDLNYFSEDFASDGETKQTESPGSPGLTDAHDLVSFSGSNLPDSDFSEIIAHKRKFKGSALRGSNFSKADLTGSSFIASDLREANFDGANLKDCVFAAVDLADASFNGTSLTGTEFSRSGLMGTRFIGANLTGTKLGKTDLRTTLFENCVFEGWISNIQI
ncbi:pentapeptide repeat-containing protein [Pedobacter sp. HDW13]|uniref:pentapeptide repeat-containing protein n=1 Tax=Pedobacter sp. HDW13 TaxID=2714940 RepID=UPI001F1045D6|nr:pentapeptide repeat-containing protein [Pedobacter sp. HDW13]